MTEQDKQWFKEQSLEALERGLAETTYPVYPEQADRLVNTAQVMVPPKLPIGPWELSDGEVPSLGMEDYFKEFGVRLDADRRPLHPWFWEMYTNPKIGVVTGKGAYWNWGPNYTADPIATRNNDGQTEVLLIRRGDTGHLALPGGFIDDKETPLEAAKRELLEETGFVLPRELQPQFVYRGPLADLRVTANAWPETTAFRFPIPEEIADQPIAGGDDAAEALWLPADQVTDKMFGSHKLLIELALRQ